VPRPAGHLTDVTGARALVVAGESTTTDHISPAGEIGPDSLAAHYLRELGESPDELNTYGCRRGNHEVMVRGTFGNPRFRNRLAGDRSGDWTLLLPERVPARVYDAAQEYARRQVPLIVLAGRDYGMGSSRDWAAKGQDLLGIRAVLAESFERIHRSNLIGAGIVPLQFPDGVTVDGLGLRGDERFDLIGLDRIEVGGTVAVRARSDDGGAAVEWRMLVRADTTDELDYLRGGGFLRSIARRLAAEGAGGGDD
jgi:aconitate hydratase